MNPKWLMGIVLLYLILAVWSGILEGSYLTSNQTGIFDTLMNQQTLSFTDPVTATVSAFNIGGDIITALWKMFWWDFAQFHGEFTVFRLILIALSIGVAFAFVLSIGRGVSN
jgi:hypothetical protein